MKYLNKKDIILLSAVIIIVSGVLIYENKVNALKQAINVSNEPTVIESLQIELDSNRVERVEIQKEIDIKVYVKKKKAERADKIKKEMLQELGLSK